MVTSEKTLGIVAEPSQSGNQMEGKSKVNLYRPCTALYSQKRCKAKILPRWSLKEYVWFFDSKVMDQPNYNNMPNGISFCLTRWVSLSVSVCMFFLTNVLICFHNPKILSDFQDWGLSSACAKVSALEHCEPWNPQVSIRYVPIQILY